MERDQPTLVLHVGDYDPSGLSIFDAAAEDVAALVRDRGGKRSGAAAMSYLPDTRPPR